MKLCDSILSGADASAALATIHEQAEAGKDLARLMSELITHLRNLLVLKADPNGLGDEWMPEAVAAMQEQAAARADGKGARSHRAIRRCRGPDEMGREQEDALRGRRDPRDSDFAKCDAHRGARHAHGAARGTGTARDFSAGRSPRLLAPSHVQPAARPQPAEPTSRVAESDAVPAPAAKPRAIEMPKVAEPPARAAPKAVAKIGARLLLLLRCRMTNSGRRSSVWCDVSASSSAHGTGGRCAYPDWMGHRCKSASRRPWNSQRSFLSRAMSNFLQMPRARSSDAK